MLETDFLVTLHATFDAQRQQAQQMALTTANQRIERIRRIQSWIVANEVIIQQAIYNDFQKPFTEFTISELLPLHAEIKHTIRHLKQWVKPQPLSTPLNLIGTKSYILHEPKGNVLIIGPWNVPFVLSIRPLISAIAAGNVVILKPSELVPQTSALLKRMIEELFPPEEVAVFEGDANVAQALLQLPFNHIFFTGSPTVGRLVMATAAKHLASITLELGGKSPFIADETINIQQTAAQLVWGKCTNSGQTCISPDYLLVHEAVKEPLLQAFRQQVNAMFSPTNSPIDTSDSYGRIVNTRNFERIRHLLNDALDKGAHVTYGGNMLADQNFIEPTLLEDVTNAMQIMHEEIFGPILPVIPFTNLDDALRIINQRDKPLTLYIHSHNPKTIQRIIERTSAGNTVINDSMLHFGNVALPFGGVNNSGFGKSNGVFSFQEFSNQRGVMQRKFGTIKFLYPPYTERLKKIVKFIIKYV